MELIEQLTQQLGITQQQASGGLGLLMGAAKSKLGGDFNQVAQHVPGVESMINTAPKADGAAGLTGSLGGVLGSVGGLLSGKVGGSMGQLGTLASLAGGFKQLGLDAGMVSKFMPVVLGFLQSKGGENAKGLIERALK